MRRLLVVCGLLVALGVSAGAAWLMTRPDGLPPAEVRYSAVAGGTVSVDGLLIPGTVAALRGVIAAHPGAVSMVQVRSGGGFAEAAADMAGIINAAGLVLAVAPRTICSSACVILIADVQPRLRRIDASAWVRVHGRSAGPSDPQENDSSSRMDRWIAAISPNWLAFLAACRSRPLARDSGLAMTWGEVQRVDRSPAAIDCDTIAYRTKAWLFRAG